MKSLIGNNEIFRYGKTAKNQAKKCLMPNENGFYTILIDNDKWWKLKTYDGKYGVYCKLYGTNFPVNRLGYAWAKAGTEKGEKFVEAIEDMIVDMDEMNLERGGYNIPDTIEYMRFMNNPKNEGNCGNCPESSGKSKGGRYPCGHFNCWVKCHTRHYT